MLSPDPSKRIIVLKREDTSNKRGSNDHAVEGIYDRIKALLLAHSLQPGQLLQIGTLAEELGVSTTPVREALTRLAAERVIVFVPKRGFFAKTATEDDLRALYTLNDSLLETALREWVPAIAAEEEARIAKTASTAPATQAAEQLTKSIGELFVRITKRSGIHELTEIVRNFNDRLHHARMIEGEIIADAFEELATLRDLYVEGERDKLGAALKTYHTRRRQLVSSICKELLFRPFLPGKR